MPFMDNPLVVSLIMMLWGVFVRYFPAMKDFPNRAIWVTNIIIGILAKLVAPDPANAGAFGDVVKNIGWLIVPAQAMLARLLFETFLKPSLEQVGILGYPATPVEGKAPKLAKHK